jgi:molybdenum cofactor synthesis domain-containing protein
LSLDAPKFDAPKFEAPKFEAKVLTVSDGVVAGTRDDASGRALAEALTAAGYTVLTHRVVADGVESVAAALDELADGFAGLIVTTGGTGFGPRDLTPEGTRAVLEREAPGIVEAVRRASDDGGRGFGMLSRAVAGTRGQALICNLPGSSSGALEGLAIVLSVAPHALDLLSGGRPH